MKQEKIGVLKKVFCLAIVLSFCSASASAFSLGIDKPSFYVETSPGETKTEVVTVYNNSEYPLEVAVLVEDWKYKEDRSKKFLSKGTGPFSCGEWITPKIKTFILQPEEEKKVPFEIKTPKNAEGGHQAVLFFEGIPAIVAENAVSGIQFVGKVGTIIYHSTKGSTIIDGRINTIAVIKENDSLVAKVFFENTGNDVIQTKGSAVVLDVNGKTVARGDISTIKVLPGESSVGKAILKDIAEVQGDADKVLVTLDLGKNKILVEEKILSNASAPSEVSTPSERSTPNVVEDAAVIEKEAVIKKE